MCSYLILSMYITLARTHIQNLRTHVTNSCHAQHDYPVLQDTATHCNTLGHTATQLRHTATHCNTLQHTNSSYELISWMHAMQIITICKLSRSVRAGRMLQLQSDAMFCNVLHRVAECGNHAVHEMSTWHEFAQDASIVEWFSVLQCVAACGKRLQCAAVCCSVLQRVVVRCKPTRSCHTYEWVMSHIWMSHVTHMN